MSDIKVSICCLAYNHEDYIEKCLTSLIEQETNFEFEILINDDCSTDKTVEIIKKFEKTQPNIIKPIYQKENQYSKKKNGQRMNPLFNFPRARGKYIAICECDDYWISKHKLQLQVDLLESKPDVNYVFSDYKIDDGNHLTSSKISNISIPKILNLHEILKLNIMPTTVSIMFRKDKLPTPYPLWFMDSFNGDWGMLFIIASQGKIGYINEPLAAYRKGVGIIANTKSFIKFENGLKTNKAIDKHTNFKYSYHLGKKEWHFENITYALLEENLYFQGINYLIKKIYRSVLENKINSSFVCKNIIFLKHSLKLFFK